MTDDAVVGRLLDEYHLRGAGPDAVRRLSGSERGPRVTYLVPLRAGAAQVIRAFRGDADVPVHARDLGCTVADWLLGRARLLSLLADAGYPAPRPVPTRTGELIGVAGPWLTWAVSYVPGPVLTPTLAQLRLLGAALGRLHGLRFAADADAADAAAADPAVAGPAVQARLAAVRRLVPDGLLSLHAELSAVAASAAALFGARSLVHGDAWARNAVQSAPGTVTLIDWETSGFGCAVLDLGRCLMECQVDSGGPADLAADRPVAVHADRVAAVAAGYASQRSLSGAEVALLPWAVRWPAVINGAIDLEATLIAGARGPSMDARLARIRNRLAVADAVVAAASPAFDAET